MKHARIKGFVLVALMLCVSMLGSTVCFAQSHDLPIPKVAIAINAEDFPDKTQKEITDALSQIVFATLEQTPDISAVALTKCMQDYLYSPSLQPRVECNHPRWTCTGEFAAFYYRPTINVTDKVISHRITCTNCGYFYFTETQESRPEDVQW